VAATLRAQAKNRYPIALFRLPVAIFVFALPVFGTVAALALVALGRVAPVHVALFVGGFVLTGLGITVGYHRLLTHRSFETSPVLKAILLILGSMAAEGRPVDWVANHLKHHAHTEQDDDPHSPTHGFFHSHWGWLFTFNAVEVDRYAGNLRTDRVAQWVGKTFMVWAILGYAIPFLIAGWEGLIWGGLFRQFAVQNVTFAVNSVCHRWGSRAYPTNDQSTNNWVVGILGLGEGWHNNHHAFPGSAFHGLRWWQFDLSGQLIRWLEATGLAWNVKRPRLAAQTAAK